MTTKRKSCGNPDCRTSTGIHEGLTFGWGRLDGYGYWEFPCAVCAREHDATKDERIKDFCQRWLQDAADNKKHYDSLTVEQQNRYNERGFSKPQTPEEAQQNLDKYLKSDANWLSDEGWPFADQDVAKLIEDSKEYFAREAAEDQKFDEAMKDLLGEEDDEEVLEYPRPN